MRKLLPIALLTATSCLCGFAQAPEKSACPTVVVNGPPGIVDPGETANFSADIHGSTGKSEYEYSWILEPKHDFVGQGTATITVKYPTYERVVTASVTVKGLPTGCPNTASETSIGYPAPQAKKIGTLRGYVVNNALTKSIGEQLSEQPYAMLFVVMKFKRGTSARKMSALRLRLTGQLNKTKIGQERIKFVEAGNGEREVVFWLVPPGANRPTP